MEDKEKEYIMSSFGTCCHEWNQVVQIIVSAAETLVTVVKDNDEVDRIVDIILNTVARSAGLTNKCVGMSEGQFTEIIHSEGSKKRIDLNKTLKTFKREETLIYEETT